MTKKELKNKEKGEEGFNINVNEMMENGVHLGHRASKTHPQMAPYIMGIRNSIAIIDLEKTKEKLEEALKFIKDAVLEGKTFLFVGTKLHIKDLVKEIALSCQFPYVNQRWLGGTITNFETILKRIEYFKDLEQKEKEGVFEKYTKKEQQRIKEEIEKLRKKFDGIKTLEKLPDIIFICDMDENLTAAKEARRRGIKVVAISDTNTNPLLADYPIPASDNGIASVKYILEKVKEVILKSKSQIEKKE
jgi:small subunit ribosomal protein S2